MIQKQKYLNAQNGSECKHAKSENHEQSNVPGSTTNGKYGTEAEREREREVHIFKKREREKERNREREIERGKERER